MDKKCFLKLCSNLFGSNGFVRKGNTFYYDNLGGILLVFGLQKSIYGPYFYMEHGIVFKGFSKHLPNPKCHELDINLGRINPSFGKALCYETMDEKLFNDLADSVQQKIDFLLPIVNYGKEQIIEQLILPTPQIISYVLNGVDEYLEIETAFFKKHRVPIVKE